MALISSKNALFWQLLKLSVSNRKNNFRIALSDMLKYRKLSNDNGFSDTTILMQNGMNIEELPLVVKRISTCNATQILFCEQSKENNQDVTSNAVPERSISDKEEMLEVVNGLRRCNSLNEILKLLEVIPPNYIEPAIAFQIVEGMIEVDHVYSVVGGNTSSDEVTHNFTKTAIFNQLMDTVLSSSNTSILVKCLKLMNKNLTFKKHLKLYERRLTNQIILMVSQNKFSINEICEIAKEFHDLGLNKDIDKLWVGIVENAENIDQNNIMNVYHVLLYFKNSRTMIANTLLNKISLFWWVLGNKEVAEILTITEKTKTYSHKILQILGRWLNTKIHTITEDELLSIVNAFNNIEFLNSQVIAALERYIKIRGDYIKNELLFASIMEYCLKFKIRSVPIFEKCCDYFIANSRSLSPSVIKSLFVPFGNLNYSPVRSYEFWKTFEETMEEKFSYFNHEHVVDMLLACVYLEKYPINFVNNVFDPYFLNRLQASCRNWLLTKKKLILFDHLMTFECKSYKGPLLSKNYSVNLILPDERITYLLNKIREPLVKMTGSADRVMFNKCLHICPLQSVCMTDVLLVPEDAKLPYLHNFREIKNAFVALLIHLPEHYTLEEDHLIGVQVTRRRHLAQLGIIVVSLNYSQLLKLCSSQSNLLCHITEAITNAK